MSVNNKKSVGIVILNIFHSFINNTLSIHIPSASPISSSVLPFSTATFTRASEIAALS